MKVIVFSSASGGCAIAALAADVDPQSEAARIAPAGADFVVVDESDIPNDPPVAWSISGGRIVVDAANASAAVAAQLLAYASRKQNALLSGVHTFNVAASGDAPVNATSRLDDAGSLAMLKVAAWGNLNAANASATLPWSNVDYSSLTLTLAQAQSLVAQAGALEQASYAALNTVTAAISATPPTITTFAQIDSAAWPAA